MMKVTKLGILIAAGAVAAACGQASDTIDAAAGDEQTFSEAAGELADDVAADVSAAAGRDATEEAKRDAAAALEEGIRTE
jgi:hypothetical protein